MHLITSFSATIKTAIMVGRGQKLAYFLNFAVNDVMLLKMTY